jgi:hypothetical protein
MRHPLGRGKRRNSNLDAAALRFSGNCELGEPFPVSSLSGLVTSPTSGVKELAEVRRDRHGAILTHRDFN